MPAKALFTEFLRNTMRLLTVLKIKKGTSRNKPAELKAYRKNQIWMWDITWLKSPVTGIWYYAYVIEDLYDGNKTTFPFLSTTVEILI